MTLKHSELFPASAELLCKYFTGIKDLRYGDLQTVRPGPAWSSRSALYRTTHQSGFVNVTFDDHFLLEYMAETLRNVRLPVIPEPDEIGRNYRAYVFSNFVHTVWNMERCPLLPVQLPDDFAASGLRRLYAMALFLAESARQDENSPQGSGPFLKLCDSFSRELYEFLAGSVLQEASPAVKCLTAAALRLPVSREDGTYSSYRPPHPAD